LAARFAVITVPLLRLICTVAHTLNCPLCIQSPDSLDFRSPFRGQPVFAPSAWNIRAGYLPQPVSGRVVRGGDSPRAGDQHFRYGLPDCLLREKTGRSPKDKRVVRHPDSEASVWWGPVNFPLDESTFCINRERAVDYLNTRLRIYCVDAFAGWDPANACESESFVPGPITHSLCTTC
jgi:hypothetical protein